MDKVKIALFYGLSSAIIAILGYYSLQVLMPDSRVFGTLYRMFLYHYKHPIQYIFITSFFYGIFATLLGNRFLQKKLLGQIGLTVVIIFFTILFSSPFGGMLWYFHDMQAGHFPHNWLERILKGGFGEGLTIGWLIILLSIPYNILGSIICFFLTRKGAKIFY